MLITVLDYEANPVKIVVQSQDTITDRSGALLDLVAMQPVMAANANRGGFLFQNTSGNPMLLNEVNNAGTSSFVVSPGAFFPPPGYPIPTGAIDVGGLAPGSQIGDTYAAREW